MITDCEMSYVDTECAGVVICEKLNSHIVGISLRRCVGFVCLSCLLDSSPRDMRVNPLCKQIQVDNYLFLNVLKASNTLPTLIVKSLKGLVDFLYSRAGMVVPVTPHSSCGNTSGWLAVWKGTSCYPFDGALCSD